MVAIFLLFQQRWVDVKPLPPPSDANSPFECLSLHKLAGLLSVCTLLFSEPLPQNNKDFVSLRTAQKWGFIRAKQHVFRFLTPCGPHTVGFNSLSLITQKVWDCSFPSPLNPNKWVYFAWA